jgi:hypothetical protein
MSSNNNEASDVGNKSKAMSESSKGHGAFYSFMARLKKKREALKEDPILGVVLAAIGVVLAIAGNEAYGWVRSKVVDPDEYIKQLAEEQRREFSSLKESLDALSGQIDVGNRDALNQIRSAARSIESMNASLVAQLELAKQENRTLQKIAEQKAGISGGYDIILSPNNSVRLDAKTVLGVTAVHSNGVSINVSDESSRTVSRILASGSSLAYAGAGGRECKISLLSFRGQGDNGSAAFANSCDS